MPIGFLVLDAKQQRPAMKCGDMCTDRSGTARVWLFHIGELTNETLSRRTDENGKAECRNAAELRERLERVFAAFRESNSWIDDNAVAGDPGLRSLGNTRTE